MENITGRQRRILEFIRQTVQGRGYPPTVREIGEAVGLTSSSSVHAQLANLERQGLLRRDPTKPRAMELQGPRRGRPNAVAIPMLGRITAGEPILADQNIEDFLAIPADFASEEEDHFALRVSGESMIGAGILDGDVVVVRRQDTADQGDIVAALLPGPGEEEATVKRFQRQDGRILLVPENPTMGPIEFVEGSRILGRVVAVMRKL